MEADQRTLCPPYSRPPQTNKSRGDELQAAWIANAPLRSHDVDHACVRGTKLKLNGKLWQVRAKKAGLTQRQLACLCGVSENAMSSQLRGQWRTPQYVKTVIRAWEMLTPEQQDGLLAAADRDQSEDDQSSPR